MGPQHPARTRHHGVRIMSDQEPRPLAHSIQCAARMLGIGRTKLYELIDSEQLHTFMLGNRRLVPNSELVKLIDQRMRLGK